MSEMKLPVVKWEEKHFNEVKYSQYFAFVKWVLVFYKEAKGVLSPFDCSNSSP